MSYYGWDRGTNYKISEHFTTKEFTCRCGMCRTQKISKDLVKKLEMVREIYGKPIIVTSGNRCSRYQAQLRGSLPQGHTAVGRSSHEDGNAADIAGDDVKRLTEICMKVFDNIGLANSFVHVDVRPKKADGTKRIWKYS